MLAVAARCTAPDQGGANAEWPSAFSMKIPPLSMKYFSISVRILSVSPCFIDNAFVQLNKLIQLRLL